MGVKTATAILFATVALLSVPAAGSDKANSMTERTVATADANAVRAVVEAMNLAISERDLPRLADLFADGAVDVRLFPAHSFGGPPPEDQMRVEAVNLKDRWHTIAPILFASTASYTRQAADIAVHVDNDLGLAWVDTQTRMVPLGEGAQVHMNRFTEICILRRQDDGWRIVAVTNNRQDVPR